MKNKTILLPIYLTLTRALILVISPGHARSLSLSLSLWRKEFIPGHQIFSECIMYLWITWEKHIPELLSKMNWEEWMKLHFSNPCQTRFVHPAFEAAAALPFLYKKSLILRAVNHSQLPLSCKLGSTAPEKNKEYKNWFIWGAHVH